MLLTASLSSPLWGLLAQLQTSSRDDSPLSAAEGLRHQHARAGLPPASSATSILKAAAALIRTRHRCLLVSAPPRRHQ